MKTKLLRKLRRKAAEKIYIVKSWDENYISGKIRNEIWRIWFNGEILDSSGYNITLGSKDRLLKSLMNFRRIYILYWLQDTWVLKSRKIRK